MQVRDGWPLTIFNVTPSDATTL